MNTEDNEFAAFEASGAVEVGESNLASQKTEGSDEAPKQAPKPRAPKPAAQEKPAAGPDDENDDENGADADGGVGEDNADADADENGDTEAKKREGHLKRLKRERFEAKQEAAALRQRLAALESNGLAARLEALEKSLSAGNSGDKQKDIGKAPDPTDTAKYPLGHLDDRYVEDKIAWHVAEMTSKQTDSVLQRQQENEQAAETQKQTAALLEKVNELSERGSDISEDYHETVVEAGLQGKYPLGQSTFEAAHEAENGAQILYDLATDPKEAARVASLSPYGQVAYVMKRNAEIAAKVKPRTTPGANPPPTTQTRGANSRTTINPATDNLDDFEKLVEADAKGRR